MNPIVIKDGIMNKLYGKNERKASVDYIPTFPGQITDFREKPSNLLDMKELDKKCVGRLKEQLKAVGIENPSIVKVEEKSEKQAALLNNPDNILNGRFVYQVGFESFPKKKYLFAALEYQDGNLAIKGKVLSMDKKEYNFDVKGIKELEAELPEDEQENTEHIFRGSVERGGDLVEILNSRQGWSVSGQLKDILGGQALEEQNSNALSIIAEFLDEREEEGAEELASFIREYLNETGHSQVAIKRTGKILKTIDYDELWYGIITDKWNEVKEIGSANELKEWLEKQGYQVEYADLRTVWYFIKQGKSPTTTEDDRTSHALDEFSVGRPGRLSNKARIAVKIRDIVESIYSTVTNPIEGMVQSISVDPFNNDIIVEIIDSQGIETESRFSSGKELNEILKVKSNKKKAQNDETEQIVRQEEKRKDERATGKCESCGKPVRKEYRFCNNCADRLEQGQDLFAKKAQEGSGPLAETIIAYSNTDEVRNLDWPGSYQDSATFLRQAEIVVRYNNFDTSVAEEIVNYFGDSVKYRLGREGSAVVYIQPVEKVLPQHSFNADEVTLEGNELRLWWD